MTTAKIGDLDVTLAAPASMAARYDVLLGSERNRQRAMAAALGLCWQRGDGRPKARYAYDIMAYGGAVIDELGARGVKLRDVLSAGGVALELCAEGLFSESEVEEAVGNSGAGGDPAP